MDDKRTDEIKKPEEDLKATNTTVVSANNENDDKKNVKKADKNKKKPKKTETTNKVADLNQKNDGSVVEEVSETNKTDNIKANGEITVKVAIKKKVRFADDNITKRVDKPKPGRHVLVSATRTTSAADLAGIKNKPKWTKKPLQSAIEERFYKIMEKYTEVLNSFDAADNEKRKNSKLNAKFVAGNVELSPKTLTEPIPWKGQPQRLLEYMKQFTLGQRILEVNNEFNLFDIEVELGNIKTVYDFLSFLCIKRAYLYGFYKVNQINSVDGPHTVVLIEKLLSVTHSLEDDLKSSMECTKSVQELKSFTINSITCALRNFEEIKKSITGCEGDKKET